MKPKLIAALSLLTVSTVAQAKAADIAAHHHLATIIVRPVEVFSWAGPYLGAQASYQQIKHDVHVGANNFSDLYVTSDGASAGLMAGFNSNPMSGAVLGIETDFLWNSLKGHYNIIDSLVGAGANSLKSLAGNFEEKWSGATRIRVGFAQNKILPFVSGGIAYSNIVTSGVVLSPSGGDVSSFAIDNSSENLVGWTAGAGADYAIAHNLLVRLEYRYNNFGKKELAYIPLIKNFHYKEKQHSNDIRVGVAYKF